MRRSGMPFQKMKAEMNIILEGNPEFPLVLEYRERADYQAVYNETTRRWEVIESMIKVPVYCKLADYDNTGTLQPEDLDVWLRCATDEAKDAATRECAEFNGCRTIKCKECGKYFVLTPFEVEWFEKKELVVPKRCHSCREDRRRKPEAAHDARDVDLLAVI